MLSKIAVLAFLFLSTVTFGQEESNRIVKKGLLRAQGNIAFGAFTRSSGINMYIAGELEYHMSDRVSVRSEGFYLVTPSTGGINLKLNHSNLTGVMCHFGDSKSLDIYVGVQPGIAIVQHDNVMINGEAFNADFTSSLVPLMSGTVGVNYYAKKVFHLFASVKYVSGKFQSDFGPVTIDEIKFQFGLGWNLQLIKKETS